MWVSYVNNRNQNDGSLSSIYSLQHHHRFTCDVASPWSRADLRGDSSPQSFNLKGVLDDYQEVILRNHQGLDNKLIVPLEPPPDVDAEVKTTERLGGLLRTYRRVA